jgi:hypothetical protein
LTTWRTLPASLACAHCSRVSRLDWSRWGIRNTNRKHYYQSIRLLSRAIRQ